MDRPNVILLLSISLSWFLIKSFIKVKICINVCQPLEGSYSWEDSFVLEGPSDFSKYLWMSTMWVTLHQMEKMSFLLSWVQLVNVLIPTFFIIKHRISIREKLYTTSGTQMMELIKWILESNSRSAGEPTWFCLKQGPQFLILLATVNAVSSTKV